MRSQANEHRSKQWKEIYLRTKHALQPFGKDDEAGGDYFVIDLLPNDRVQMVELHRLHMLRPEVMMSLQAVLADFPGWKVEICAICPEEMTIIDVGSCLVLHHDKIFDALDRALLPPKYRFAYEGSRRPPGGFNP
jgi:hypothetical protein